MKAIKIKPKKVPKVLAPEQLRYAQILMQKGELDTTALSSLYADRRGLDEDYFSTYSQLKRLEKADIAKRREIERATPPHNAMRKVSLWSITSYGKEVVERSNQFYRSEYEKRQKEL